MLTLQLEFESIEFCTKDGRRGGKGPMSGAAYSTATSVLSEGFENTSSMKFPRSRLRNGSQVPVPSRQPSSSDGTSIPRSDMASNVAVSSSSALLRMNWDELVKVNDSNHRNYCQYVCITRQNPQGVGEAQVATRNEPLLLRSACNQRRSLHPISNHRIRAALSGPSSRQSCMKNKQDLRLQKWRPLNSSRFLRGT